MYEIFSRTFRRIVLRFSGVLFPHSTLEISRGAVARYRYRIAASPGHRLPEISPAQSLLQDVVNQAGVCSDQELTISSDGAGLLLMAPDRPDVNKLVLKFLDSLEVLVAGGTDVGEIRRPREGERARVTYQ